MEGHAGYNPSGPDVVCASLSAASQMTANGIIDCLGLDVLADDDDDVIRVVIKENNSRKGKLEVRIDDDWFESMEGTTTLTSIQQLFKSFAIYIQALAEQYPENVSIERSEG